MGNASIPGESDLNRAALALAIVWTWCALSILFVGLRVFTRVVIVRQIGVDDFFIMIALFLDVVFSILFTVYASNGGCRHIHDLTAAQRILTLKFNWVAQPVCVLALVTGKVSVALLILRMLVKVQRWQRWFLYFVMSSVTILGLVNCVLEFAQCSPPRALWTASISNKARCWPPTVLTTYAMCASAYFGVVDLALAILPTTIIWRLQLRQTKKIALCIILAPGIFAAVSAAYKVTRFPEESARADLTWNTVSLFIWMVNEINVVIITASIPTIQPFVKKYWKTIPSMLKRSEQSFVSQEATWIELSHRRGLSADDTSNHGGIWLPEQAKRISKIIDVDITID